jgi:8-oxo-dGTP pyrophosphatase MutT (NUDIX family)
MVSSDRPIRPAATVLMLRDGVSTPEVFMVRRHRDIAFMGGAHVFPGGSLDPADREAADPQWCDGLDAAERQLPGMAPTDAIAFHVAAIRELFEEAGILLARRRRSGEIASFVSESDHGRFKQFRADVHAGRMSLRSIAEREDLRLALDALILFAHWVTPPIETRRYDTRFFVTRVPPEQIPVHDEAETTDSEWITARGALAAAERGEIVLPPPTWVTLRELEPFDSAGAALAWARRRAVRRREPSVQQRGDTPMLIMPGDPEHPNTPHGHDGSHGDDDASLATDRSSRDIGVVNYETRFVWTDGQWRPLRHQ